MALAVFAIPGIGCREDAHPIAGSLFSPAVGSRRDSRRSSSRPRQARSVAFARQASAHPSRAGAFEYVRKPQAAAGDRLIPGPRTKRQCSRICHCFDPSASARFQESRSDRRGFFNRPSGAVCTRAVGTSGSHQDRQQGDLAARGRNCRRTAVRRRCSADGHGCGWGTSGDLRGESGRAVRGIAQPGNRRRAVARPDPLVVGSMLPESARTVLLRRRCECGADHDRDRSSTRAHLRRAPELSRTAQTASRTSGRRSRRPSGRQSFPSGTLPISPWPGAHIAGDGRRGPWICFANEPLRWQVRYQSA